MSAPVDSNGTRTAPSGVAGRLTAVRGTTPIAVAIISSTVLLLWISGALPWLQGRLNIETAAWLLGPACFLQWIVAAAYLLARVSEYAHCSRPRILPRELVALACAALPWLLYPLCPHKGGAYLAGFTRWAAANVDREALCRWCEQGTEFPLPTSVPCWWPLKEDEPVLGSAVPTSSWPAPLSALKPREVRVLPHRRGLLLELIGTPWGVRFVYVGDPGGRPPDQFREDCVTWCVVKPGVQIAVFLHP